MFPAPNPTSVDKSFGSLVPESNPSTSPFFAVERGELSQGLTVQLWTLGTTPNANLQGMLFWLADNFKAEMTLPGTVRFTTPHGSIETKEPEKGGVWVHWSFVYNPQRKGGMELHRHGKHCDTSTGCIKTSCCILHGMLFFVLYT